MRMIVGGVGGRSMYLTIFRKGDVQTDNNENVRTFCRSFEFENKKRSNSGKSSSCKKAIVVLPLVFESMLACGDIMSVFRIIVRLEYQGWLCSKYITVSALKY